LRDVRGEEGEAEQTLEPDVGHFGPIRRQSHPEQVDVVDEDGDDEDDDVFRQSVGIRHSRLQNAENEN
jgi:hypothetical protein